MAENVISIRPADLSYIEGSLSKLNSNLSVVNENIELIEPALLFRHFFMSRLSQRFGTGKLLKTLDIGACPVVPEIFSTSQKNIFSKKLHFF